MVQNKMQTMYIFLGIFAFTLPVARAENTACSLTAEDLREVQSYTICASDPLQARCALALQGAGAIGALAGGFYQKFQQQEYARFAAAETRLREGLARLGPWGPKEEGEDFLLRRGMREWLTEETSRIQGEIPRQTLEDARQKLIDGLRKRIARDGEKSRLWLEQHYQQRIAVIDSVFKAYPEGDIPTRRFLEHVLMARQPDYTLVNAVIRAAGGRETAAGRAVRGLIHPNDYLGQSLHASLSDQPLEFFPDDPADFRASMRALERNQALRPAMSRISNQLHLGIRSGVQILSPFENEAHPDVKEAMRLVLNDRTPDQMAESLVKKLADVGWTPAREFLEVRAATKPSALAAMARFGALRAGTMAAGAGGKRVLFGALAGTGAAGVALAAAEFALTPVHGSCQMVSEQSLPVDSSCKLNASDELHANVLLFLDRATSDNPEQRALAQDALRQSDVCDYYKNYLNRVRQNTVVRDLDCGRRTVRSMLRFNDRYLDLTVSLRAPDEHNSSDPIQQIRAVTRWDGKPGMQMNAVFTHAGELDVLSGSRELLGAARAAAIRATNQCAQGSERTVSTQAVALENAALGSAQRGN